MEDYSKEIIDMKFDKLKQESVNHYQLLDQRFNTLDKKLDETVDYALAKTQAMLLEERIKEKQERELEQRITTRWLIGISVTVGMFIFKELILK
ncbi:hypothetical protein [Streptococcus thoraltensis]|uniref:hypothetical protein n=1 Tax=Streptococcus thoraltensis TaxID=55085 RepID=UPI001F598191|nr:hypothetical protein [Streptococcus thoraltensis]